MKQKLIVAGIYWIVILGSTIAIALQHDNSSRMSAWNLLITGTVVYLFAIAVNRIRIKRETE